MIYYEITIIAVHRFGGSPRIFHRNFYNVDDTEKLRKRIDSYLKAWHGVDYEIYSINILRIDNDKR